MLREILKPMPGKKKFLITFEKNISKIQRSLPADLVKIYSTPILTKEQEIHLFRKMNFFKSLYKEHNNEKHKIKYIKIRNFIMDCNMKFLYKTARDKHSVFKIMGSKRFISDGYDELCAMLSMTLMRAVESYNWQKNFKFSTYMNTSFKREIHGFFSHHKLYKPSRFFTNNYNTEKISTIDLFEEVAYNEETFMNKNKIKKLTRCLSKRNRILVSRYFCLNNGKRITLEALGKEFNLTKERVRQLIKTSLEHMKNHDQVAG